MAEQHLPQVAETNTPCLMDADGKCLLYDELVEQVTQKGEISCCTQLS